MTRSHLRLLFTAALLVLLAPAAPAAGQDLATPTAPPGAFVDLHDAAPTIVVEMRYRTAHNFLGRPCPATASRMCIVTRQAAEALAKVQEPVTAGATLKVYDCYRPQRAVDAFVAWGKRLHDTRMKAEFYPRVDKRRLFKEGYIAAQSGHSRGSTVDLTLVRRPPAPRSTYTRGDRLRDCAAAAGAASATTDRHGHRLRLLRPARPPSTRGSAGAPAPDPSAGPCCRRLQGARGGVVALHAARRPFPDTFFDFPIERSAITP